AGWHRSIVSNHPLSGRGSPRGRGCAEGASGSAWKGVVDPADSGRNSGGGGGSGKGKKAPPRVVDTKKAGGLEKKGTGSDSPAARQPSSGAASVAKKTPSLVDVHEKRLLMLWKDDAARTQRTREEQLVKVRLAREKLKKDEQKRTIEMQRQILEIQQRYIQQHQKHQPQQQQQQQQSKRPSNQQKLLQKTATAAEEHRRNLELQEMKKAKAAQTQAATAAQIHVKEVQQRYQQEVAKQLALLRRNQVSYWSSGRPALSTIKTSDTKLVPTPIVPQDLYRKAVQNMLTLRESTTPPLPAPPPPPPQEKTGVNPSSNGNDNISVPNPTAIATVTSYSTASFTTAAPNHFPRDYHDYYQLGSAGAEQQPQRSPSEAYVPPPVLPVGLVAGGLTSWKQETAGCLDEEWPISKSA
ncbi:unnamed protein product, partial [Ectocarpus sp. 4 AP-2014]